MERCKLFGKDNVLPLPDRIRYLMKEEEEKDHKFAKELEECSDKGIEISQECKEYYKRKFEGKIK